MPKIDLDELERQAKHRISCAHGDIECTRYRRGGDYCGECRPSQNILILVARVRELEAENERLLKQCSDLEHKANGWTRV